LGATERNKGKIGKACRVLVTENRAGSFPKAKSRKIKVFHRIPSERKVEFESCDPYSRHASRVASPNYEPSSGLRGTSQRLRRRCSSVPVLDRGNASCPGRSKQGLNGSIRIAFVKVLSSQVFPITACGHFCDDAGKFFQRVGCRVDSGGAAQSA